MLGQSNERATRRQPMRGERVHSMEDDSGPEQSMLQITRRNPKRGGDATYGDRDDSVSYKFSGAFHSSSSSDAEKEFEGMSEDSEQLRPRSRTKAESSRNRSSRSRSSSRSTNASYNTTDEPGTSILHFLKDGSSKSKTVRGKFKNGIVEESQVTARRNSSRSTKFRSTMADHHGTSTSGSASSSEGEDEFRESSKTALSRSRVTRSVPNVEDNAPVHRRTSSRSTKFTSSMAEPSVTSILDLLNVKELYKGPTKKKAGRRGAASEEDTNLSELEGAETPHSPQKTTARRHSTTRLTIRSESKADDEAETSSVESFDQDGSEDSQEEPLKIQRIIASRTEMRKTWNDICKNMNTSEIDFGSRWFQADPDSDGDRFEERFLVKWSDLSYMHCSWETKDDLVEQLEGASYYFKTFFRKSENGLLFSAAERCDGDYFDPAFTEVERILEIHPPDDEKSYHFTYETEDSYNSSDFGMVFDKSSPDFEQGTGRQFLIKWMNTQYSESTYEFERDLILNDIDYKDHVKDFLRRGEKPSKHEVTLQLREGEKEFRRLYMIFGDKSHLKDDKRDEKIAEFQRELQGYPFKNGGELRDYQVEGICWMLANFVNRRSVILADSLGLGKTLQTVATMNYLKRKLHVQGPFLIVVPLSTLGHWQREFTSWTDLNTVVYHGNAEDRSLLRELEFAFQSDRPSGGVAPKQLYLKKCGHKKSNKSSPWMVEVVITTPEVLVLDDFVELAAVSWEALVVDEAHRMKNVNSKLGSNLRDDRFAFNFKILLTGTPIQNDILEFWSLLNFIDPEKFGDTDSFMERYGEMRQKERLDEFHDLIRPYILRRLKEDVEKSIPPKEETLIEVELTLSQKQYYRALYEKNVKFLNKSNKSALNSPSLNNIAMQLRKCCNHVFLINGVEEELRAQSPTPSQIAEGDFLAQGSGKLILLDKLLPRLKEEGHRVLIFSNFKIMLDILEDFLNARSMTFERIDGSITGRKRQQAIDRFQRPPADGKEPTFIMMLSTRAGGVGITLTAADTVILFDTDWNPQNDIQAQGRCHRIGQTKSVKVYRLLSAKTYEMHVFQMSSMKMGLDKAVLKGFEGGEFDLTKEEVERLLRHGAYDIFNEEKNGNAEAESNSFIQSDIDSILQRRSRTVVHESQESQSGGSNFSKAQFRVTRPQSASTDDLQHDDIDLEDPDFWSKVVGEPSKEILQEEELTTKRRIRSAPNYSESEYQKTLESCMAGSYVNLDSDASAHIDDSSVELSDDERATERVRWGGSRASQWKKEDVELVLKDLLAHGYSIQTPGESKETRFSKVYDDTEVNRMRWSLILQVIIEATDDDVRKSHKRENKILEKARSEVSGIIASDTKNHKEFGDKAFRKIWSENSSWLSQVFDDMMSFIRMSTPRSRQVLESSIRFGSHMPKSDSNLFKQAFAASIWPSLRTRGWTAEVVSDENCLGETIYVYEGRKFFTPQEVLIFVGHLYPELSKAIHDVLKLAESSQLDAVQAEENERSQHLSVTIDSIGIDVARQVLQRYGPLQLVFDRQKSKFLRLPRKVLVNCYCMHTVRAIVSGLPTTGTDAVATIAAKLNLDKRWGLPHPMWTARQDAVMIVAIHKHGWIDEDTSWQAISKDESVQWRPPFDAVDDIPKKSKISPESMISCATRASILLNRHRHLFEETKLLDVKLIAKTYGLMEKSIDIRGSPHNYRWEVDPENVQSMTSESELEDGKKFEVPTKKDLLKRARLILARPLASAIKADSTNVTMQTDHGIVKLNLNDPCNLLLAELLRAVLKSSASCTSRSRLCHLAREECNSLMECIRNSSSYQNERNQRQLCDLERISDHIKLVENSLTKAATPWKNVIRVILGEEPRQAASGGPLFPTNDDTSKTNRAVNLNKAGSRKDSLGFSAERAIFRAIQRFSESNKTDITCLCLSQIETIILYEVSRHGIPILSDDEKDPSGRKALTWRMLGLKVVAHVDELKRRNIHGSLLVIEDSLSNQAAEYAEDPSTLSKKTLMMLSKFRNHAGITSQSSTSRQDGSPGQKVMSWFGKEICRWAERLDLVDQRRQPLAFLAFDFLTDLPEDQRHSVQMASVFDKRSCRDVLHQVALVSRCRNFQLSFGWNKLQSRIEAAVAKINSSNREEGDQRQSLGGMDGYTAADDALLLKRILELGMTDLMLKSKESYGYCSTTSGSSYETLQISAVGLQRRANQLVREIHANEETEQLIQLVQQGNSAILRSVLGVTSPSATLSSKNDSESRAGCEERNSRNTNVPKSMSNTTDNSVFPNRKKSVLNSSNEKRKSTGFMPNAIDLCQSPEKKQRAE